MATSSAETLNRRSRLDHEAVMTAAEALVDERGIDALTMTMLASALGTKVSSLYNHVASLDDLRSEIQIRTMRLLGDEVRRAAMGVAGEDGLRRLADAFLDFARSHPRRYDAMTRPIIDRRRFFEAGAAGGEGLAAMVGSTGIDEAQVLSAQAAFFAALHGYGSLETSGFFSAAAVPGFDPDDVYARVLRGAIAAMLSQD